MAKDKGKKRGTANRLTRADKIMKRLRNIDASSGFKVKGAVWRFSVYAKNAVEIGGYLVSEDANSVSLRHKRTSASKRTVISRFPLSDVIEVYGAVGEVSSVTVMRETLIREVEGTLVSEHPDYVVVRTLSDETVKLVRSAGVRIEIVADDVEGSGEGKKSKKSKKDKAEGKKAKKDGKKSKKSSDDDDDDLED